MVGSMAHFISLVHGVHRDATIGPRVDCPNLAYKMPESVHALTSEDAGIMAPPHLSTHLFRNFSVTLFISHPIPPYPSITLPIPPYPSLTLVIPNLRYNMPDSVQRGTDICNYIFTVYFLVEMIIKVTGLGPHAYVSDNFNIFDAIVTIVGVIEMALTLAPNVNASGGPMSVFRAFRLLRIFRLARSWKSLNRIIMVLINSLASVGWLTVLLFLYLFIGGLLGMMVRQLLIYMRNTQLGICYTQLHDVV